ncbi:MAG TPA: hypothetical protein VFR81_30005 [Longimicrobium sp.]|nr:hypothetical protein [Longimicrobium sp.]
MGAAAGGRATYIAELLDHHVEELGFLWGRWRAALGDPDYTVSAVAHLEERIRAHLQGVQAPGERALPRLTDALHGDDAELAFAAAYALLHRDEAPSTDAVLAAFEAAEDEVAPALAMALAYSPLRRAVLERLRAMLSARPALRAAAAAEALVFHGALDLGGEQLRWFLEDDDPAARLAGWRLAALLGARAAPESYARALRDDEPAVAAAALEAGAWCGVQGVLPALRRMAEAPSPERMGVLRLLAVLGTPEDASRLYALACAPELGPERFRLAGAFGDPRFMPLILKALADPDPATAVAAGAAFVRLTGVEVRTGERATLPPEGGGEPDDFEAEFLERVTLPDPARARREWETLRPRLERAPRICRGMDVALPPDAEAAARLDMESRRDLLLRRRFHDGWKGTLLALEAFPQCGGAPGP